MKTIVYEDQETSTREISTKDSSSICTIREDHGYIKLQKTSIRSIFPLIYFFTSALFISMIIFLNIFKKTENKNEEDNLPNHPFPSFFKLYQMNSNIYIASFIIISLTGFLNVWFFCNLLIQRFSVPELRSNKIKINFMFFLGTFANIIFIFYGFSNKILEIETEKIKFLRISLSMIIFLTFIFFNIFYSVLTLNIFLVFKNKIAKNDKKLKRNIRIKLYMVYLGIFLLLLFLSAITIDFYLRANKLDKKYIKQNWPWMLMVLENFIFTLPYLLFIVNSLLNLTNFNDIRYIEEIINIVVDKEYFLTSDDSELLLGV